MSPKFQHFNDLEASRYEELKRDIAERGVLIPVITDEDGTVIDGHQRRRACAELHVECPSVVVPDLTEDEKHQLAIVLNLFRRQLSGTERSKVIGELARMRLSTRRIGAILGVSHQTVGRVLDREGVERPETVMDDAGREQPSRKPERDVVHVDHVPDNVDLDTGEITTGGELREDAEVSDGAGASDDEGVGVPTTPPAPSVPLSSAAHPDDSYRSRMSREMAAVRNGLLQLDPSRMREVSDLDRCSDVESLAQDLREWCERVEAVFVKRPRMEMVK